MGSTGVNKLEVGDSRARAWRGLDLLHMMALALSGDVTGTLDSHTGPHAMMASFPFQAHCWETSYLSKTASKMGLEQRAFVLHPQQLTLQ